MSSKTAPKTAAKPSKTAAAAAKPAGETKANKKAAAAAAQAAIVAPSVDNLVSAKSSKGADNIVAKLGLTMKSGKVAIGYKSTLKQLRSGKALAIILSANCPPLRRSEIEYYAMLTKTTLHQFGGNNTALGTACGKFFQISCMTILDGGDSDLIAFLESQ